eukprot:GHVS01067641.1.p1 GENE.GHVS01067641.1~~GHVS01067641.1.p1  ORF type:complete len:593 (+),score=56.33 GHVS01067641.1:50-1828(+)
MLHSLFCCRPSAVDSKLHWLHTNSSCSVFSFISIFFSLFLLNFFHLDVFSLLFYVHPPSTYSFTSSSPPSAFSHLPTFFRRADGGIEARRNGILKRCGGGPDGVRGTVVYERDSIRGICHYRSSHGRYATTADNQTNSFSQQQHRPTSYQPSLLSNPSIPWIVVTRSPFKKDNQLVSYLSRHLHLIPPLQHLAPPYFGALVPSNSNNGDADGGAGTKKSEKAAAASLPSPPSSPSAYLASLPLVETSAYPHDHPSIQALTALFSSFHPKGFVTPSTNSTTSHPPTLSTSSCLSCSSPPDYIVVQSATAAAIVLSCWRLAGRPPPSTLPPFVSLGPSITSVLLREGFKPVFAPPQPNALSIGLHLSPREKPKAEKLGDGEENVESGCRDSGDTQNTFTRVLLLTSRIAPNILERTLSERKDATFVTDRLNVYDTLSAKWDPGQQQLARHIRTVLESSTDRDRSRCSPFLLRAISEQSPSFVSQATRVYVCLSSPSAVREWERRIGGAGCVAICIGESTAGEARKVGSFSVVWSAEKYEVDQIDGMPNGTRKLETETNPEMIIADAAQEKVSAVVAKWGHLVVDRIQHEGKNSP